MRPFINAFITSSAAVMTATENKNLEYPSLLSGKYHSQIPHLILCMVLRWANKTNFRGATKGTTRLLLNAVVYGSGLGANTVNNLRHKNTVNDRVIYLTWSHS